MEIKHVLGNTYYIEDHSVCVPFYKLDEKRIVLLDGGLNIDPQRSSLIELLSPYEIVAVISTHAHPDHVGVVGYYQQLGATVYMPAIEAESMASAEKLKANYYLFNVGDIEKYFGDVLFEVDIKLEKGCKRIEIEDKSFGILWTEGHSAGHICVMTPDNVLYLADAILSKADCLHAKLPYTFSIHQDKIIREKLRNINALGYILAHGGYAEEIDELLDMNEQCFEDRTGRVMNLVDKPMTLEEIMEKAIVTLSLRQNTSSYVFRIYERNIRTYVNYLCDIGKLEAEVKGARLYYSPK